MKITAIITAAGKGTRAGFTKNKVLITLPDGKTVLEHAAAPFDEDKRVNEIIVTASAADVQTITQIATSFKTPTLVVEGGETRTQSVQAALNSVSSEFVLVHDAARPFVTRKIVDDCINCLLNNGSAVTSIACVDTIGTLSETGKLKGTSRENNRVIQTPQGFITHELKNAFSLIKPGEIFTDEAGVYCKYIGRAYPSLGDKQNVKLTYIEDFESLFPDRFGTGFDLHNLVEGRKLVLGGITIPHNKGLLGHSDADVLTHAVMDALLSAAALKDIGCYFSDKDPAYKDISSMILLERVIEMLAEKHYKINNLSAVIMAEKPKLNTYVDKIRKNLAAALNIPLDHIGISCTTLEGMGLIGTEQAIAVNAVVSIKRIF